MIIAHANIFGGHERLESGILSFPNDARCGYDSSADLLTYASGTFWFDDFGLDQGSPALYPFHPGFPVVATGSVFFSSPVVADINNDGANELLIAGGDASTVGIAMERFCPGFPWTQAINTFKARLAVADLDGNGDLEIAAGTKTAVDGQGRVFIWHHKETLLNGWPKSVAWNSEYANNDSLVGTIVLPILMATMIWKSWLAPSNNTAGYRV